MKKQKEEKKRSIKENLQLFNKTSNQKNPFLSVHYEVQYCLFMT